MDGRVPEASDRPWYVVQTKPRKEALVERSLGDLALRTYVPRIVTIVRAGRQLQRRVEPMFPTYLFTEIDPEVSALRVRYLPGVKDFLRADARPQPIPPEIIALLRERTGSDGVFEPPPRRFQPGERVRIEYGPLAGLDAVFERELSGPERVAVLLASINLSARVILANESLSAA